MKFSFVVGISFFHSCENREYFAVCSCTQDAVDFVCSQLRDHGYYAGGDYQVEYVYRVCTWWRVSDEFFAQNGEGA